MHKKYAQLSAFTVLTLTSAMALAVPFSSFDPRSMAMGGTGVAVDDPATAPFFNPAMLSESDHSKKFSVEFATLGVSLVDLGNLHSNWSTMNNAVSALPNNVSTLSTNANTLSSNAPTLTSSIAALSTSITSLASATPSTAAASLAAASTNLSAVTTNMSTVSSNVTTVGNNANTVSTNINQINKTLISLNNQPMQGELGAASVIAIPGKNWGFAVYANAWAAVGGRLEYKDAGTVTTLTSALTTTSTNLVGIGAATGNAASALSTANTSLNTAVGLCTTALVSTIPGAQACSTALTNANTALGNAQPSVNTASSTVTTNSANITAAANSVNNTNKTTFQSVVHIRGVAVTEYGASISHGLVSNDVAWSWGITPKVMQMRLYDATIGSSSTLSNATSNDYLAYYSTLNFDAGIAKTYLNGWRTGLVVKNVIPQTFDFKNALTPGATPVADGSKLNLSPQVRAGISYEQINWFNLALDADLTKNDPAGLENPSQYVAVGGEFSTSGWAQIRAGYRADLVNSALSQVSIGLGISPRLPYYKPHLDLAITASPNIFNNGYNAATQVGAYLQFGLNF
jgi:hypothetical protein